MIRKILTSLAVAISIMLAGLIGAPSVGAAPGQTPTTPATTPANVTPGNEAMPTSTPTPTAPPTSTATPTSTPTPTVSPSAPWPGPYDIEAVGATVAGSLGSVVRIKVGLLNHGPAVMYGHPGSLGGRQSFRVALPPGTTIVGDPGCENGDPTAYPGTCRPGLLRAGESVLVVLDLKIVGPVTRPGKVIRTFTPGMTPDTKDDMDTNPDNNTADIIVRVTAAGPALPATGSPTIALVAAALSMVIIGGLLVLASRRPRRR